MNKIFFITFASVMLLFPLKGYTQEKDKTNNQFDKGSFLEKRSAFITAELGLTPEEAALFIPLCEELQQKKFEAGQQCRKLSREMRSKNNPTGADYTKAMDECLNASVKEAQLEKEYYERFKEILSPEKLYKYKDVEHKFMREFMRGSRGQGDKRNNENKNR